MSYLEIYGLCGSGKSTLQLCLENSDEVTITVSRPISISLFKTIYYSLRLYLRIFSSAPISSLIFILNQGYRRLLLKEGLRIAGIQRRSKIGDGVTLLTDSGVIMPIVSAVVEQNLDWNIKFINMLLENLPLPDFAVYVRVLPATSFDRYVERESADNCELHRFESGDRLCTHLHQWLCQNEVKLIEVDNNGVIECEKFTLELSNLFKGKT